MKAVYPGSFDPLTYGHLDIIKRASKNFDVVYVAVAINITKDYFFDYKERKEMIEECVKDLDNVIVVSTDKLIVDFVREREIPVIIRGLRAVSDFENELQIATTNYFLNEDVETIFYMSRPQHMFMSSSQVREIAKFRGDLSSFVPLNIAKRFESFYE